MPKMVKIGANPKFVAKTEAEKELLAAVKKAGALEVPFPTAKENVAASNGLYMILPEAGAPVAIAPRALEEMSNEELKAMMLTAGVAPQKQMRRSEIIKSIRLKMDAITIADEEDTGAA